VTQQCPYCGRSDRVHVWAGEGGCPGAASERVRDQLAAANIAGRDLVINVLQYNLSTLRALCARAADVLESTDPKWEGDFSALIAELRKAAQLNDY